MLESLLNKVSGLSQMFFKIGVLKIFCKFHRKTSMLESLFNKVSGLKFIKKKLQHRCFPVKVTKLFRTPTVGASGNRKIFHCLSIFYYYDLAKCSVHSTQHNIITSFLAVFFTSLCCCSIYILTVKFYFFKYKWKTRYAHQKSIQ